MPVTKASTISLWLRPETLPNSVNEQVIFAMSGDLVNQNTYLSIKNNDSSNSGTGCFLEFRGANQSNTEAILLRSNANNFPIVANQWMHVLISCNTSINSACYIRLNNANSTILVTGNTGLGIDLNLGNTVFGADITSNSNYYNGGFSECLVLTESLDISNVSRFLTSDLLPQNLTTTIVNTFLGPSVLFYLNGGAAAPNTVISLFNVVFPTVNGTFSNTVNTPLTEIG